MWVRGLKLSDTPRFYYNQPVAPHVGAWIEIHPPQLYRGTEEVAPHVGAWIEMGVYFAKSRESLVAPHVGAWIEIYKICISIFCAKSHPMWVRGLKSDIIILYEYPQIGRTPCGCVD